MASCDNTPLLESKFSLLAEMFNELSELSPSGLRDFLKDYRHLFCDVDNNMVKVTSTHVDQSCQTEDVIDSNQWNPSSIVEDVTGIAEKVTLETGFCYDENSGWYYDFKMNCYYNPNYRLYYYKEHNSYYYYDEESKNLKYYCSPAPQGGFPNFNKGSELMALPVINENRFAEEDPQPSGVSEGSNVIKCTKTFNDKEEGECSSSDGEIQEPISRPVIIEAGPTVFEPDNTKHFAPCIRVIVKSSTLPSLSSGTLFIVTCTGGTIGREGEHDVLIPDHLVSKMHCKFQYVNKDGLYVYELIDLGSKNGTYVDGKRLSDSLVQSEPTTIIHGSVITVGHTDLLCHIHQYDDTCSDCAPVSNVKEGYIDALETRMTLKEKHNINASIIKKKFGINQYSPTKYPEGYEDRAEARRKQVGSSHNSEKTQTSSVNEPICKKNKGYTLLSKMGWKEGEPLGKINEGATLEPVLAVVRINKKSGLGCGQADAGFNESKKSDIAVKTLERYNQIV